MSFDASLVTDFKVYDTLAQTAYVERIQDVLEVFNGSSNGAIRLRSEIIAGDFSRDAFYAPFGTAAHRAIGSNAPVDPSAITGDEIVGVKTDWKFGPYAATEESFKRRARSVDEFFMLAGQSMAEATLEYMIQAALASLDGAIGSNGNMITQGGLTNRQALINGLRKFGDRFGRVAVFVMDSSTYFDVVEAGISDKLYEEAGVVIYGGTPGTLGKPVLVTDTVNDAGKIFGLQSGAVEIVESQAPGVRSYEINDRENLTVGFRSEGSFNVNVMGYSWIPDTSPINNSPNLAALGTTSNWTKVATSDKATAGVIIEVQGGGGSGGSTPAPVVS